MERALEVQFLRQAVKNGRIGPGPKKRLKRLPLGRLALLQKAGYIAWEQGKRLVEVAGHALDIAASADKSGLNRSLEVAFGMAGHGRAPWTFLGQFRNLAGDCGSDEGGAIFIE